jgi:hypothetical protein
MTKTYGLQGTDPPCAVCIVAHCGLSVNHPPRCGLVVAWTEAVSTIDSCGHGGGWWIPWKSVLKQWFSGGLSGHLGSLATDLGVNGGSTVVTAGRTVAEPSDWGGERWVKGTLNGGLDWI